MFGPYLQFVNLRRSESAGQNKTVAQCGWTKIPALQAVIYVYYLQIYMHPDPANA